MIFKVPVPKVSFAARTTKAPQHMYDPGGLPERPMGGDCKSPGSAFEGSNPSPATKEKTPSHQMRGGFLCNELVRGLTCTAAADVISIHSKENNCAYNDVLPFLLKFEDTKSVDQNGHDQSTDDGSGDSSLSTKK